MAVLQPSEPLNLMFGRNISFDSPQYNGGSRISDYEVHSLQIKFELISETSVGSLEG